MEHNEKYINSLLDKYIKIVDDISNKNKYNINIQHLLYIIIPSFVLKYGLNKEKEIIECFTQTKISLVNQKEKYKKASFIRTIKKENNKMYIEKSIILSDFLETSYIDLIDELVHEFNHAINCFNKEIKQDLKYIYLRSGLCYTAYDLKTLKKREDIRDNLVLEEVINTKQTEEIIDIIKTLSTYNIHNEEIKNTLLAINNEIKTNNYKSNAYYFQSYICTLLMQNKTFVATLENLRFVGNIDNVDEWFDDIVDIQNGYKRLSELLEEILKLEEELVSKKHFKKKIMNKIKGKTKEVLEIVKLFDDNTIYK